MARFDAQIETAKRLIAKNGQLVTWRSKNAEILNPNAPFIPSNGIDVDRGVKIVFLPPNRVNQQFLQFLSGTEIQGGSVYGLMGAVDFTPVLKDVVIRSGETLRIKSIDPLAPNGQIILYTVQFNQ